MRHRNKVKKLQRGAAHRRALLSNLVCSLIEHKQIRTTLAKAKAVRPLAEKMVTLGKRGDLHARRQAAAVLRQKSAVSELFVAIAPAVSAWTAAVRGIAGSSTLQPSSASPAGTHR